MRYATSLIVVFILNRARNGTALPLLLWNKYASRTSTTSALGGRRELYSTQSTFAFSPRFPAIGSRTLNVCNRIVIFSCNSNLLKGVCFLRFISVRGSFRFRSLDLFFFFFPAFLFFCVTFSSGISIGWATSSFFFRFLSVPFVRQLKLIEG